MSASQHSDRDEIFGEGSDARIRGEGLSACPYTAPMRKWWKEGWIDAHMNWGAGARPQHTRPLPEIAGLK